MIARATRGKSGVVDYLVRGEKAGCKYTRKERDNVEVLYGNLNTLRKTENYLNKYKDYTDNHLHLTLSFSSEDIKRLNKLSDIDRKALLNKLIKDYIKHHTSGYDIDNEVIAYAELHKPKIKLNEEGNRRYEHIHIIIALYNPLSDTKLQTTFFNNAFIDDTLQAYSNKKYNLTQPKSYSRVNTKLRDNTDIAKDRKYYIKIFKDINSNNELLKYFKDNDIQKVDTEKEAKEIINKDRNKILYREVKTKNNHYYKIVKVVGKEIKDINLKGRDLTHIQKITEDKNYKFNEHKTKEELEEVLQSYYKKRIVQIDNRRSIKTKEELKEIYTKDKEVTNVTSLSSNVTFQEKIFYKHYKSIINYNFKGFYIDDKDDNNIKFINKSKNINIEDKGDKIVSNTKNKENIQEKVKLMLNIAEAKKWNIATLIINGSDNFKVEAEKQIAQKLKDEVKRVEEQLKKEVNKEIDNRVSTVNQQLRKEQQEKELNSDIKLNELKQKLNAMEVLKYAISKYKLNIDDYELTEHNKINNTNNRQKPKNIIDFLQREVNLTTRESIEICRVLYNNINVRNIKDKKELEKQEEPKEIEPTLKESKPEPIPEVYEKPPIRKDQIDIALENTKNVPIIHNEYSNEYEYISAEDDSSTPLDHQKIIENMKHDLLVEKTEPELKEDMEWAKIVEKNSRKKLIIQN